MYGIVNKAIEDMVIEFHGPETWEQIKETGGVEVDYFLSNEPYDDAITYQLVGAASTVLNAPAKDILNAFGEYWILKTGKEKYAGLMEAGGSSLKEFLFNLPIFHNRIMLIYPNLQPPEFKISDKEENAVRVHYYSSRDGLQEFVRGLLTGLGKMFQTPATVELVQSRTDGFDHDVFKVSWS